MSDFHHVNYNPNNLNLSFSQIISGYVKVQCAVVKQMATLGSNMSSTTPGTFLMLQFQMSQLTQIGDSISNVISQVNSMCNNAIRNQKSS
jgi:hypothetical protein